MDAERRNYLKKQGKKQVEQASSDLQQRMKETNPAKLTDPEWAKNYKQLRVEDARLSSNRNLILPAPELAIDFIPTVVKHDFQKQYLPIQGFYIHCLSCDQYIPMNPEIQLVCKCKLVLIDPANKRIRLLEKKYEVVKLHAKILKRNFLQKLLAMF